MQKKTLHKLEVVDMPYLDVVDLRNDLIRIRSIDHPNESIDVYKNSLPRLADTLLKAVREIGK